MNQEAPLRLGTRGSDLARRQTQLVVEALARIHALPTIEVVVVATSGDAEPRAAWRGEITGVFTSTLEEALRAERIDVAIHSLKDLPTESAPDLCTAAILPRDHPADALVDRDARSLADLPARATVGTCSLRRRSLLLARRPDLRVVDLHGNVPTRVRAVEEGRVDAAVVALAGLRRLNLESCVSEVFAPDSWLPAPGQGAIAVRARRRDTTLLRRFHAIDHRETRLSTAAERGVLAALSSGCRAPLGAFGRMDAQDIVDVGGQLTTLDGSRMVIERLRGQVASEDGAFALGRDLAARLLNTGGREVLVEVERALRVLEAQPPGGLV